MVNISRAYVTLSFGLLVSKDIKIIWFFLLLTISVHDDGYYIVRTELNIYIFINHEIHCNNVYHDGYYGYIYRICNETSIDMLTSQ
jgi:hypothetical protein